MKIYCKAYVCAILETTFFLLRNILYGTVATAKVYIVVMLVVHVRLWIIETHTLPRPLPPQELEKVTDGSVVYKLVGPVLLKQDLTEAKVTVQKRLDYIGKEMWVTYFNLI